MSVLRISLVLAVCSLGSAAAVEYAPDFECTPAGAWHDGTEEALGLGAYATKAYYSGVHWAICESHLASSLSEDTVHLIADLAASPTDIFRRLYSYFFGAGGALAAEGGEAAERRPAFKCCTNACCSPDKGAASPRFTGGRCVCGLDEFGFDKFGFNKFGFDKDGYDPNGLDKDGYDREGYDKLGYDADGYGREG